MNVQIMRAFVRMRAMLISNQELARKLMNPTPPKRRSIGFTANLEEK